MTKHKCTWLVGVTDQHARIQSPFLWCMAYLTTAMTYDRSTFNPYFDLWCTYETFTYPDIAGITLDVMLIPHNLRPVQTCTWWHMVQWQKKCVNRERPWEDIKRTDDKPNELQMRPGRKGWKGMLIIMTIFAIEPVRLMQKWATTNFLPLLWPR